MNTRAFLGVRALIRRFALKDCGKRSIRVRIDFPNGLPPALSARVDGTQSFEADLKDARRVIRVDRCRLVFGAILPFREVTASCNTDELRAFLRGQREDLLFRCRLEQRYEIKSARLTLAQKPKRRRLFLAA